MRFDKEEFEWYKDFLLFEHIDNIGDIACAIVVCAGFPISISLLILFCIKFKKEEG